MSENRSFNSSANVKRTFFPKTSYSIDYNLRASLLSGELSGLIDGVVTKLLPEGALGGTSVLDFKGRDVGAPLLLEWPERLRPLVDEILFVSGRITSKDDPKEDPFSLQLHSKFLDFPEGNRIRHSVSEKRIGYIPEFLHTRHIGKAFPLWPDHLRFALDSFSNRFSVAMLGFTPLVTQSLRLEAHQNSFALSLVLEKIVTLEEIPFSSNGLWRELCSLLSETLGFHLPDDYRQQTRQGSKQL